MLVIPFHPDPTGVRASHPPRPSPGYSHSVPAESRARTSVRPSPLKSWFMSTVVGRLKDTLTDAVPAEMP